jgi:hypothetical protein
MACFGDREQHAEWQWRRIADRPVDAVEPADSLRSSRSMTNQRMAKLVEGSRFL